MIKLKLLWTFIILNHLIQSWKFIRKTNKENAEPKLRNVFSPQPRVRIHWTPEYYNSDSSSISEESDSPTISDNEVIIEEIRTPNNKAWNNKLLEMFN